MARVANPVGTNGRDACDFALTSNGGHASTSRIAPAAPRMTI